MRHPVIPRQAGSTRQLDHDRRHATAFTVIELLVIVGVLAVWISLMVPALARTQPHSDAFQCANNLKQLITAWQMYANDNNGRLVMNFHGGMAQGGGAVLGNSGNAPWAQGWLDWTTSSDNTNGLFLTDARYAKLSAYVNHAANIYRCPADRYVSASQRIRGWTHRARSVSANLGIGDGNAELGPWNILYRHIRKSSDFLYPGPAETFVFLDEHPDSINDPGFFSPHQSAWVDQPATYHNGAGSFAFADGHTEIHKWVASLSAPRAQKIDTGRSAPDAPATVGDADLHWVSYHTQRNSENSY